jgi:hypothetical protein
VSCTTLGRRATRLLSAYIDLDGRQGFCASQERHRPGSIVPSTPADDDQLLFPVNRLMDSTCQTKASRKMACFRGIEDTHGWCLTPRIVFDPLSACGNLSFKAVHSERTSESCRRSQSHTLRPKSFDPRFGFLASEIWRCSTKQPK